MGILGPTRMQYSRVIAVLEAMKKVMNEALIPQKGSADQQKEEKNEG